MSEDPDDPQDEAGFLILAPYRSHLEILKYSESRVIKANCGHFAWLSPQGEGYVHRFYTSCTDCADEIITDPEAVKRTVPGSLAAVRRTAGAAVEREARALMEKLGISEDGHAFRRPPNGPR